MFATLRPPVPVTTTLAVPALPAGVLAVIEVELTTLTAVAGMPPIVTSVTRLKSAPVIVTACPPAGRPLDGLMDVTVGGA